MADIASKEKIYDLAQRTEQFAKDIILFARKIPKDVVTLPLISQLVRAGTSIALTTARRTKRNRPEIFSIN